MKAIHKLLSFNSYSFGVKILLSVFIFILIFNLLRSVLIFDKVQSKNVQNELNYISRSLLITKQQLKVTGSAIGMQRKTEVSLFKEKIENTLLKIYKNTTNKTSNQTIISLLKDTNVSDYCSYIFKDKKEIYKSLKNDDFFDKNNEDIINSWQQYKTKTYQSYYFYNYHFKNKNIVLNLACKSTDLNPNHREFENSLKDEIQTKLLSDLNLKSAKTVLFWINLSKIKDLNKALCKKDLKLANDKYGVSNLSNVKNLITGSLSTQEILNIRNNNPIEHIINEKTFFTWIIRTSEKLSKNGRTYFLTHSILKEELIKKNQANSIFLLPETLISIAISFIIILFIFKHLFKNINILTNTAKKIKQGKNNIRTNIKGKDDIGILAESFDEMIDFFENNIKLLDDKVNEKTKEINKSLEEKETLLKEIHHRVKNNLALTISLIELQEEEVEDIKTKRVLVNIQERIYAMELLHRKLYESTNLNKIPLKAYVNDLISMISESYNIKNNLELNIHIEDIDLNMECALLYGLILNELVTNSFKYALNNINNPILEVNIKKKKDSLELIVKDNGKGLSKNFEDLCTKTLGLKLINTITIYQLDGKVTYQYDNGSKFIIEGKI